MSDKEIPDIVVVVGDSGTIAVSPEQAAIKPKFPLIVEEHSASEVELKPVVGEAGPLGHLAVLRPAQGRIERYRVVKQLANGQVAYIDPTVESDQKYFLGITTDNAASGRPVSVCTEGILSSPEWDWTLGPVHADVNGVLTQNFTATSFEVATALSDTTLRIKQIVTATLPETTNTTIVWDSGPASTQWNIVHNLERYPTVTVVDSARNIIHADIVYLDINTVQVNFAFATGGQAYIV